MNLENYNNWLNPFVEARNESNRKAITSITSKNSWVEYIQNTPDTIDVIKEWLRQDQRYVGVYESGVIVSKDITISPGEWLVHIDGKWLVVKDFPL